MTSPREGERMFWELADEFMKNPAITEGKIMSSRCLRANGEFVAMVAYKSQQLVVKLTKNEVDRLIGEGVGLPFAPAKKVFKEWVEIKDYDRVLWRRLIADAIASQRRVDK